MAAPRILIVDDQRDISRMLRAALETLGRGYEVVDALSAEEALLEIQRLPIDLLITDLRLPGITGLELIARLRSLASQAHMIVISAYADERTRAECKRLGATFFEKPLSLAEFIKGVQALLADRTAPAVPEPRQEEQPAIADRLARLRRDLGAVAVCLVDLDGKITVRAGDVTDLDFDAVLTPLMMAFSASMRVCQVLGGTLPGNVHFFDGSRYDIYCANVGRFFALVMVFQGERGANQMGPVMRYGRQCADDLLAALKKLGVEAVLAQPPAPKPAAPPEPAPEPMMPPGRRRKTAPIGARKTAASDAGKRSEAEPAAPPVSAAPTSNPGQPLTADDLKKLDEAARKVDAAAAASFWDAAAENADLGDLRSDTLSWEQAKKLGLIPPKK